MSDDTGPANPDRPTADPPDDPWALPPRGGLRERGAGPPAEPRRSHGFSYTFLRLGLLGGLLVLVARACVAMLDGGDAPRSVEAGDVVIRDDFESSSTGWQNGTDVEDGGHYHDGRYVVTARPGLLTVPERIGDLVALTDVRIRAVVAALPASANAYVALACRVATREDFYLFLVSNDGTFRAVREPGDVVLAEDRFPTSLLSGRPLALVAECTGGNGTTPLRLRLLAGRTELGRATDDQPIAAGGVGLGMVNVGSVRDSVEYEELLVTAA